MTFVSIKNSVFEAVGAVAKKYQFEIALIIHFAIWALAFMYANQDLNATYAWFAISSVFVAFMEGIANSMKPKFWGTVVPLLFSFLFAGAISVFVIQNPSLYVWLVLGMWVDGLMTAILKWFPLPPGNGRLNVRLGEKSFKSLFLCLKSVMELTFGGLGPIIRKI